MKLNERLLPALLALFVTISANAQAAKASMSQPTASPESEYRTAWSLVRDRYVDGQFGGQDWTSWEHKYDGQLHSMPEAYQAIQTMLDSLHDRYTRISTPVAAASPVAAAGSQAVVSQVLNQNVGYIKINSFASSKCAAEFEASLKGLSQAKAIVIDLRGNKGGYVEQALEIADMFLSGGDIVTTVSRDGSKTFTSSGNQISNQELLLLVDEQSASATEILAGALHENHRATILGSKTFGKGLVQEIETLPDGALLFTTVSHYLTPSGTDINHVGLQPDVPVSKDDDAIQAALQHV